LSPCLSISSRVAFVEYNFFDPQPEQNVVAFLSRQCTHNWADEDVVKLVRSFVPGLERSSPDTPLLINDIIIPEPGIWPRHEERHVRQVDMAMLINSGAKQRTLEEFKTLLGRADGRYLVRSGFDNGPLGLLEVYLVQS
jgi:hypothetical protein